MIARFGAQAGLAYSKTERMYCLYNSVRVSFCCPKSVSVSVRSVLSRCVHFCLMSCMWSLKLSEVSYVTPRIFVECLCGIAVLSSVSCGVCRCSFVWMVRRVIVDLVDATYSRFVTNQVCSVFK